jgi:hypothetical protein
MLDSWVGYSEGRSNSLLTHSGPDLRHPKARRLSLFRYRFSPVFQKFSVLQSWPSSCFVRGNYNFGIEVNMGERTGLALATLVAVIMALVPARAQAAPFTTGYSDGYQSATVTFDVSGQNLIVTLTNTATVAAKNPNDVLTGIFFDVAGSPSLTAVSADICKTCSVTTSEGALGIPGDPLSVAGEWGFKHKPGLAYGADYGLSAVSAAGRFLDTSLIAGPNSNQFGDAGPSGIDYGITTVNDNASKGANPLVSNQVIFTLTGLPPNFDPSAVDAITHIQFQYGTATKEAPEPGTLLLLSMGVAGAVTARRRRKAA